MVSLMQRDLLEEICREVSGCEDVCGDIERACGEIREALYGGARRSLDRCQACVLGLYIEGLGRDMMIYEYDEKRVVFAVLEGVFLELREDGGEAVPLEHIDEYIRDLRDFGIYPEDLIKEITRWVRGSEPSP